MPSSIGSKVPFLIVGALSVTALASSTISSLRSNNSQDLQSQAVFTGNQYFVRSTTSDIPKTFVDQNSVLSYNTPAAGDVQVDSGALAFNRYRAATAKLKSGSGTFMAFRQSQPFTATGSRQTYTAADIAAPCPTATCAILRSHVETEKAPTGAKITCHTHPPSLTTTGVVLRNQSYTNTQSGATLVHSTGSVIIPPNWGVRCWFAAAPGAAVQGVLKIWLSEYFVP